MILTTDLKLICVLYFYFSVFTDLNALKTNFIFREFPYKDTSKNVSRIMFNIIFQKHAEFALALNTS